MGYKDLENWAAYTSIKFLREPPGLLDFAGDKRTALIILPVGSKFTKKARNLCHQRSESNWILLKSDALRPCGNIPDLFSIEKNGLPSKKLLKMVPKAKSDFSERVCYTPYEKSPSSVSVPVSSERDYLIA